ncbi:SMI1/KNR4 family protein [Okeanomitos corallinicola TIOX110]|uniref:SMI1/KNR4 family protein n=1 Tax=Okeanomitos corallinicola TIOX110 TaxID=3133117 RepID=A0ABZ2UX63_9CYAN
MWIPLTYDGGGNHCCLDLDPAEGGNLGQIITMWHDDGVRAIIAPIFRAWLQQYADNLGSGDYGFEED